MSYFTVSLDSLATLLTELLLANKMDPETSLANKMDPETSDRTELLSRYFIKNINKFSIGTAIMLNKNIPLICNFV